MKTTNNNNTLLDSVLEDLSTNGINCMINIFTKLFNEAMKIERNQALNAGDYERNPERLGYANGYKPKTVNTGMGKITVQIPQARGIEFYPQSLEKGCRSERALKSAIAEMYINGVSTRKVTEITEKLCGFEISSTQVSRLTAELDQELNAFRNRPLGTFQYVYLDARYEKVRNNGVVTDVAVLIATAVNPKGFREVIGVSTSLSEAEVHWTSFLSDLKQRGLSGVELFISDSHQGLVSARKKVFPETIWQRCQFHFAQNAQSYAPKKSLKPRIAVLIRRIFNAETKSQALDIVKEIVASDMKTLAPQFCDWLEANVEECLNVYHLPSSYRQKLRTVNPLELVNREIKRRTQVATIFPNTNSLLRLVTAVLVEIHENWISSRTPYLNMNHNLDCLVNATS